MRNSKWMPASDSTIAVDKINGRPKKITGTRLGTILGTNPWKTPFQAWCEITRVAEPPFEGNKYTDAGQIIEPKLIERCKEFVSPDVITPEEYYHSDDPKRKTGYDFFNDDVFGGMWDALYYVGDDLAGVIECKTSSRPQDWVEGVPAHYAVQGQLYAYLLGLTDVWFAVALLDPADYDDPDGFECTDENTVLYHMTVGDDFAESIETARKWWERYIHDGAESPEYDDSRDRKYLDLMRTNKISAANGLETVVERLSQLDSEIASIRESSGLTALEEERKAMADRLKAIMTEQLGPTDDKAVYQGWVLTKTTRSSVDTQAMKRDGIYDKYAKVTETMRLTEKKEG